MKKTEQVGNHLQNERNDNERNHEMELPEEQMNDFKERVLNELGVLQETDMKDRKTLMKIKVTKKLKTKLN